jgi:hypothetical protein
MPLQPTQQELVRLALESWARDIHTAIPGRIEKYDAAKQVADVLPVIRDARPAETGETELFDPPVIPNVPVQWPRGGGYALHFPLAKGDHVILLFQESAIGQWRESGEVAEPGDLTRFGFGYPIAIPGIAPNAGAIEGASSSEARIIVGPGGALAIGDAAGIATAQPVVTADAFLALLTSACSAAGAAAVVAGANGAAACFTAFIGAFASADLFSSSKLKAQFP